ncbi:MAG: L-2-amino-thiazoline-4-carboxylic acid hydrolase, partial [Promethearchaeota archaeon]
VLSERNSRVLMEQLRLQETYSEETGKAIVPYVNYERARNLLQYNLLKALADVLGRDSAIQAYREIVEYLARELTKREPVTLTFPQLRESMIHHSSTDGGFTFAIAHLDESMFLAKFDRCVIYESLRDVDDPELGYYATCYTGLIITNHQLNNLRMRRTQTLFTGSFCDELRWDPSVHDEPKQPPLKYSRSLIIE